MEYSISYEFLVFEKLIGSPGPTMEKVFSLLGIHRKYIRNSINAMDQDSQQGTVLSQARTKSIATTGLTLAKCKRYNALCTTIGLPSLFECN